MTPDYSGGAYTWARFGAKLLERMYSEDRYTNVAYTCLTDLGFKPEHLVLLVGASVPLNGDLHTASVRYILIMSVHYLIIVRPICNWCIPSTCNLTKFQTIHIHVIRILIFTYVL